MDARTDSEIPLLHSGHSLRIRNSAQAGQNKIRDGRSFGCVRLLHTEEVNDYSNNTHYPDARYKG